MTGGAAVVLQKLKASHRKQVGTTEAPTTDMYGDCQELLQLFGLPYIIAPAEAEAQCAWLDAQGLVDGVVTDDNDAFLFGAKHIYRCRYSTLSPFMASHNVSNTAQVAATAH